MRSLRTMRNGLAESFSFNVQSAVVRRTADAIIPPAWRPLCAEQRPNRRSVAHSGGHGNNDQLAPPLDGPPTAEWGACLELPRGRVSLEQTWSAPEPGRPARTGRVTGTEMVNGTLCLKIAGIQQSDDWDRPRADHTAWRRED